MYLDTQHWLILTLSLSAWLKKVATMAMSWLGRSSFHLLLIPWMMRKYFLLSLSSSSSSFFTCIQKSEKKDLYRREGTVQCTLYRKGRHCCSEDRIASIPCRASYFAPGWFYEYDHLHQDDLKNRMNSSYSLNRPGAK